MHSPAYGLRSYLYILLHWIVALPAKIIAGDGPSKTVVFYTVRLSLGIICGTLEFKLIRCVVWCLSSALLVIPGSPVANSALVVAVSFDEK